MNEILNKVQTDLGKLQKTLEREGEILLGKLKEAANKAAANKSVQAKRKEIEKLVEAQIKRFEPALDKFYSELKTTASKYGVDMEKVETKVRSAKEKAASTFGNKKKSKSSSSKSAVGGTKKTKKKASKKV